MNRGSDFMEYNVVKDANKIINKSPYLVGNPTKYKNKWLIDFCQKIEPTNAYFKPFVNFSTAKVLPMNLTQTFLSLLFQLFGSGLLSYG